MRGEQAARHSAPGEIRWFIDLDAGGNAIWFTPATSRTEEGREKGKTFDCPHHYFMQVRDGKISGVTTPDQHGNRISCGEPSTRFFEVRSMNRESPTTSTEQCASLLSKHVWVIPRTGYPWLIHRLTYSRTNRNLHVRGYKEEGTITTVL